MNANGKDKPAGDGLAALFLVRWLEARSAWFLRQKEVAKCEKT
ncbi:MAG: hypothetical protein BSOLF_1483 [Candidatus Carbobacillus altaicus]|uniref:Uncharacterized protein n=1 Tax=Candidatus Carbonibacillus altaicus TaxID=2163959 RepID=A0A2R6XZB0_9BACL|nr:MAG: hypothetical protein BSOLF_1483 [Candidatus Carbobacillus altaicus]